MTNSDIHDFIKTGTPFQQAVWKELLKIPYGSTLSYKEIAYNIGRPKAVRAVGTAVSTNQIFYKIPCHRVVRSDGKIGNYKWGHDVKVKLLDYEKQYPESKTLSLIESLNLGN